jgi:hypothetical protein
MFTKAIRRLDRGNYTLMAVVYLFAADTRLWSMTEKSICYSGVDFSRIRLRNCSVGLYTLYCAAKDLYYGTDRLIIGDLADAEVVPPKVFNVVCNAMAICRVGLDAIYTKERNKSK